jgi:hypothetical protein
MFLRRPIAVIDTNVIVALFTCADIVGAVDRNELPDRQYWRLIRAREALHLGIYLNSQDSLTVDLHNEAIDKIRELVPPVADVTWAYTHLFSNFVYPELLPAWRSIGDARLFLKGNEADDELLRLALERSIPLITFEGHTPNGLIDQKLREKAKKAGADVFTPGEFVMGKLDEAAVDGFLARYQDRAQAFAREETERYDHYQGHLAGLAETLKRVLGRWPDA